MGTNPVELGPVGKRVAANVSALRRDRRLTLAELSSLMRKFGRPILPSGLSKIEAGSRRVDADDLVALALALDVTPNRLLLTASAKDDAIDLTQEVTGPEATFWAWATGEERLPLEEFEPERPPLVFDFSRSRRFRRENRPHVPPSPSTADLLEHAEVLQPLVEAANKAVDAGVPEQVVDAYLSVRSMLRRLSINGGQTAEGGR